MKCHRNDERIQSFLISFFFRQISKLSLHLIKDFRQMSQRLWIISKHDICRRYVGGSSLCPTVHLPEISAEFLSLSSIFPSPEFVYGRVFALQLEWMCVDLLGQRGIRLLSVSSRYISFSTNEGEARYSRDSGSMLRIKKLLSALRDIRQPS